MYLVSGAVMERNRRWKKKVDDYIFDSQISYHTHRVMRIMSLPLFKIFDLSKFHDQDCIINNPFKTEGINLTKPFLEIGLVSILKTFENLKKYH